MSALTFVRRDDPRFAGAWDALFGSEQISPFFSRRWVEYQIAYAGDQHLEDLSFVGLDDSDRPAVICPLFLEQRNDRRYLSYRGEYLHALRAPIVTTAQPDKQRERARIAAFEEIDRIAQEREAAKLTLLADPLCGDTQREGYNYLTRFGFIDASLTTVLLDLGQGIEKVRSRMRSSYRPLINKTKTEFDIQVFDATSITPDIFGAYAELHHRAAGRRTRPERTFEIQHEMIRAHEGILVGARQHGIWKGFVNFLHSASGSYYASGAQDPELHAPGIGAAMQWSAMTYYAGRHIRWMELDNQYFGPQLFEIPSRKETDISFYKRGFGGNLTPLFRGTKYYDRDVMAAELTDRAEQLVDAYFAQTADAALQ